MRSNKDPNKIVEYRFNQQEVMNLSDKQILDLPPFVTKYWDGRPLFMVRSLNNYLSIKRKNGEIETYAFYPGFVFDHGSIPLWIPRSLIPHIGKAGANMAFEKHDADFCTHINGLLRANLDLADMLELCGWKRWQCKAVYWTY